MLVAQLCPTPRNPHGLLCDSAKLQYSCLENSLDRGPCLDSWVRKTPWRWDRLPTPVFLGFPGGSAGKESACNVGDLGSIPGLGRSPAEGKGYPRQYSGLENSMDCILYSPWGCKESDMAE